MLLRHLYTKRDKAPGFGKLSGYPKGERAELCLYQKEVGHEI